MESAEIVDGLEQLVSAAGHNTIRADLAASGFDAFMSAAERQAYLTDSPLITPEAAAAAATVRAAEGLVVCYPIVHGTAPPRVKSWQERVFVLGVGFEFLPSGRITGALHHMRRACVVGVETDAEPRARNRLRSGVWRDRNDYGPCLARSFYLSSNRTCRSRYLEFGNGPGPAFERRRAERLISRW